MKLPKTLALSSFLLASFLPHSQAAVHLSSSVAGFGAWNPTLNGEVFAGGNSITSGVTTLSEALSYVMLPQGAGGDPNGRANGNNFGAVTVTYTFDDPLNQVESFLLWNYSEDFGGDSFNERGVQFADVTVTHAGGTSVFNNVEFAQTPDNLSTNSTAQLFEFGELFNGVTSVALGNLRGYGGTNGVGNFFLGWGEFAVVTSEELDPGISPLDQRTPVSFSTLNLASDETSTLGVGAPGPLVTIANSDGFSIDSVHTIDLVPLIGLQPGTFELFKYDGAIGGNGFAGLQLGETGRIVASLVNNPANSSIDLVVSEYQPIILSWDGTEASNLWDEGVTSNWLFTAPGGQVSEVFFEGDSAFFSDLTGVTNETINLVENTRPLSVAIVNGDTEYVVEGEELLIGTIIEKVGSGNFTFLTDTTAETDVLVAEGTLAFGNGTTGSLTTPLANVFNGSELALNLPNDSTFITEVIGQGTLSFDSPGTIEVNLPNVDFQGLVNVKGGTALLTRPSNFPQASFEVAAGAQLQSGVINSFFNTNATPDNTILVRSGGVLGQGPDLHTNMGYALTLEGGATLSAQPTTNFFGSWLFSNQNASAAGVPTLTVAGGSGAAVISAPLIAINADQPLLLLDVDDVTANSDADLVISGSFGAEVNSNFGLEIDGGGTVLLGSDGTFTGGALVTSGEFILDQTGVMDLVVGANGVATSIRGEGSARLSGQLDLDLTGADLTSGNSWVLVDVQSLSVTYDSETFGILDFTETDDVHTFVDSGNTWTFSEATGILTLETDTRSAFEVWLDGFPQLTGADRAADADPDGDDSPNLIEFVTNGDPTVSDPENQPNLITLGENLVTFSFVRNPDVVGSNLSLAIEFSDDLLTWPDVFVVGDTAATSSDGVLFFPSEEGDTIILGEPREGNPKRFARLTVSETAN